MQLCWDHSYVSQNPEKHLSGTRSCRHSPGCSQELHSWDLFGGDHANFWSEKGAHPVYLYLYNRVPLLKHAVWHAQDLWQRASYRLDAKSLGSFRWVPKLSGFNSKRVGAFHSRIRESNNCWLSLSPTQPIFQMQCKRKWEARQMAC